MDSSGFSSPRSDCFPAGLRVLVVDDDPTWLKILEKMLKKCNYEVTTCNLAREALDLLRERKDGFEIVISDVNMPDMDGFKLLEHVGLEMDLPVIMMSVDGETSRVMKGVQHGACDYLLKPIRMKELRNIWQHVYRKRIHEVRDIEGHESFEEIQLMRNGMEHSDDNYLFSGDFVSGKKRKDVDSKHDDRTYGDNSSVKKARVVWTVDLHQKFVKAVNQIGFEKVGPKKILDLMGVPWLTRENVASHLQKYRLYLTRLQQENELKATFGGLKHSDFSPKDPPANAGLQNSMALQSESYNLPGPKLMVHTNDSKISEGNVKKVLSMSKSEPKNSLFGGSNDPPKSTATSRISFSHSFGPLDSDVKPEPKMQARYSWSTEVSSVQFKQEHKQKACFETEKTFDHLPQSMHHIGVDSLEQSLPHNPEPSTKESGKPAQAGSAQKATKVKTAAALFSVQPGSPFDTFVWNSKNHGIDEENLFDRPEPSQRNLLIGTGSALKLSDEEFNFYSSQVEFYPSNAEVGNIGAFGYNDLELIADVPPNLYDPWSFGWEYPRDPVEYPVIDQGLFA